MTNQIRRLLIVFAILVGIQGAKAATTFPIATNAALVEFSGGIASGGSNYLVGVLSGTNACVQLVSTNGSLLGSLVTVGHGQGTASFTNSDTAHFALPSPVFGSTNYLVVWYDTLATEAYGQIISRSGVPFGSAFLLSSTTNKVPMAVASDGTNYLVVLESFDRTFYGRFVTANGTLSGGEFIISSQQGNGKAATAAFGKSNYLVAWQSNNGGMGNSNLTFGALVTPGGSVNGPGQIGQTSSVDQNPLATAFDGTNFLVVWNWHAGPETQGTVTNWEVFGRLVTPVGTFPGNEIQLVTDPGDDVIPALAFGGSDYLLAWGYGYGVIPNTNLRYQFLDRTASPAGSEFSVFTAQGANAPLFAFNGLAFDGTRFVTAAVLGTTNFSSGEVLGAFITPAVTPYQIYGYVLDNLSNPVNGVDVSASNGVGNVYSTLTDGTGHYSINVSNGTWDVSVDCAQLTSLGYDCTNDQTAIISGANVEKDFTVQQAAPNTNQFTYITNNNTITITGYTGTNLNVTIPGTITGLSVTSIGDDALDDDGFASVTIPNSVTSIGSTAFANCFNLTSVIIPGSVTSIGDAAFGSCGSLTSITIPASVTSIGDDPFAGCSSLTAINVDPGNLAYISVAGVLLNHSQTLLIQYPEGSGATSYTISNTVTSIGDYAFFDMFSLNSVTIPASVASIGVSAFAYCDNLTGLYFQGNAPGADPSAFQGDNTNGYDFATAYYLLGTTGWSSNYDGLPTAVWGTVSGAPRLTILHSDTNVIVTWPTNATGYTLQFATNLSAPGWSNASPAPVVVNTNYTVTNGISGQRKFYRLFQ